jgi:hypothetical protein
MRARARTTAVAIFALFAPVAGCGACEPDRAHPTEDAPSSTASAPAVSDAASAGIPAPPVTVPPQKTLPCRAIAVDGDVRIGSDDGGAPLARQEEITPGPWVSLLPSARLVAKDPRTTRETTFFGPGRARPCVDSVEESWVASGTFESAVGAGETPGAEEWVVTPLCVVRFAAAKLTVEAFTGGRRDAVRVAVAEGVAFVWPSPDATTRGPDGGGAPSLANEGWARVSGAALAIASASPRSPHDGARLAIEACRAQGRSAHDLANALVGADADGATAAAQVRARRLARAACAVAAVRVDVLPESAGKETLSASLKKADELWRSVPSAM